jgi:hypothetical protein
VIADGFTLPAFDPGIATTRMDRGVRGHFEIKPFFSSRFKILATVFASYPSPRWAAISRYVGGTWQDTMKSKALCWSVGSFWLIFIPEILAGTMYTCAGVVAMRMQSQKIWQATFST